MCLLIVLTGLDPEFPILVAGNRDEDRARLASPPGLYVGRRHRMLSPRDRRHGGTWMAVSDHGMFAGLTNLSPMPARPDAPSRGRLPHLALDQDDLEAALSAVREEVARAADNPFQLVLSDGRQTAVVVHGGEDLRVERPGSITVLSNEHRLGELAPPGLESALAPGLDAIGRLEALRPILCDEGGDGRHRILKKGGAYGTVSSSLIAVHRDDPRRLVWRYAPGPPDGTAYRDYGNLGRRLLED